MVRKMVSSEEADPTLSKGWSYFCEITKYREHVAKYGHQKDIVRFFLILLSHLSNIFYTAFNLREASRRG